MPSDQLIDELASNDDIEQKLDIQEFKNGQFNLNKVLLQNNPKIKRS